MEREQKLKILQARPEERKTGKEENSRRGRKSTTRRESVELRTFGRLELVSVDLESRAFSEVSLYVVILQIWGSLILPGKNLLSELRVKVRSKETGRKL